MIKKIAAGAMLAGLLTAGAVVNPVAAGADPRLPRALGRPAGPRVSAAAGSSQGRAVAVPWPAGTLAGESGPGQPLVGLSGLRSATPEWSWR